MNTTLNRIKLFITLTCLLFGTLLITSPAAAGPRPTNFVEIEDGGWITHPTSYQLTGIVSSCSTPLTFEAATWDGTQTYTLVGTLTQEEINGICHWDVQFDNMTSIPFNPHGISVNAHFSAGLLTDYHVLDSAPGPECGVYGNEC